MLNEVQQAFAYETAKLAYNHGVRVRFTFKKISGDERTIVALPRSLIPVERLPNLEMYDEAVELKENTSLCVFGEDEKDWRSFRISHIISMEVLL